MKIKNKKRFILYILLYIIGFLYFHVYIDVIRSGGSRRFASMAFWISGGRTTALKQPGMMLFVGLSFFLIVLILKQTDLTGPKLNRTFLLLYGLNLVVGGFVDNLVRWLFSDDSIEDLLTALEITFGAWLFVLGLPLTILYIVWKKTGHSATYRTVADIMTEEEFARWQDKKKRRADKWRAIKEKWRNGGR